VEKNHRALDTGGGRDVKIGRDLGLERFQAQPKWETPAKGSSAANLSRVVLHNHADASSGFRSVRVAPTREDLTKAK